MLRSVIGPLAANMMLVQCNSDVPIVLACSIWFGNSPDHDIIETASLENLEGLRSGRQRKSRSGHMRHPDFGPEAGAITPHPVQDHAETSCKGNHRSLGPAATGNLHRLYSKPC